ncbi:hypothetical protein GOP47_0020240 [Adiantum capillus-veneris]|uniref:Pentatricopeptide repeat-containing protein n=1 Tax=Adiantum capillus-veneris TaxID=13818 RepID=A0A9D4Z996_ADICA|nr:hypothetical protein GOP47_0020240 [Adiantum capillus-veneris]
MQLLRCRGGNSLLQSFHGELQYVCATGELDRAMSLIENSPSSSESSYMCLLKACAKRKALPVARRLQRHFESCTVDLSSSVGEHLVLTLARCGATDDALFILHTLPHRTVFAWTAIISSLADDTARAADALCLYQHMIKDNVDPDSYTFVALFKACGCVPDLEYGKLLHAQARWRGLVADLFVCSALVCMYGKCGTVDDARAAFRDVTEHNTVSWTAMASAFVDHGLGFEALLSYRQMIEEGVNPNQAAFVTAIQACGLIPDRQDESRKAPLEIGMALHADAHKQGLASDPFVVTTLVNLYGKSGALSKAQHTFKHLKHPTIPTWNSLISACIENDQIEEALKLYVRMLDQGLNPDCQTYVFTLQACGILVEREDREAVKFGDCLLMAQRIVRALHTDVHRNGFTADVFVGTTLLSAYGKCGLISEAEDIFTTLPGRNLITWNALLSAYTEQGEAGKALLLYSQMLEQDIGVDDAFCACVLQACCEVGSVDICTQMHFYIICMGSDANVHLIWSVLHAYGSSASTKEFGMVFGALAHPDVVILNACITGYAREGNFFTTAQAFKEWILAGFYPDEVTFATVLSACSHAGLVDVGAEYFEFMSAHYHLHAKPAHYVCMVDLLGRAGVFSKVENIVRRIRFLDVAAMWSCLMCACCTHGHYELGKLAFLHASRVYPEDTAAYVLMSNMFSSICSPGEIVGSISDLAD